MVTPANPIDGLMARGAVPAITPDADVMTGALPAGAVIEREAPQVDPKRQMLVDRWRSQIVDAKTFWGPVFRRMREDMDFAKGRQWAKKGRGRSTGNEDDDPRYVANIVHRHVQQKVSGLYARNPRVTAKRKEKLLAEVWDGTNSQVQQAMLIMQQDPMNPTAVQILKDFNLTVDHNAMMDKVAKTLELIYNQQIAEQDLEFKAAMKALTRRAVTTGVGYVRLGFQRVMKMRPETERQISDYSEKLATIERLSADIADGETDPQSADAEQLRLTIQALRAEQQILLREGISLSYPASTAIIPDPECVQLKGFVGCGWVAEEFVLSAEKVQEIYKVDVGSSFNAWYFDKGVLRDNSRVQNMNRGTSGNAANDKNNQAMCVVWEIYNRNDGLVYTICDGYPDFLVEPAEPDVWIERFWPWFSLTLNDIEHYDDVFPLSDVRLIKDMQLEVNRSRQGLREHRIANRPKIAVASGLLDEEDIAKLKSHPANAVLELNALQPGQKIEDVLQAMKMPGIDPNLYDVAPAFQDMERTVGVQEANLGGTSNGTATESSIAESSRMTQMASNIDDINDLLTELARAAGQVLLSELDPATAKKIAGPAAVWPSLSREEISDELELKIEAGSTGRPNQAMEIANAERIMPLLFQIPGINAEYVAKDLLRRLDDSFDMSRAFTTGLPSIAQMNSMPAGGAPAGPQGAQDPGSKGKGAAKDPAAQGGKGANNAPKPEQTADPLAPPAPNLRDFVAGRAM